MIDLELRLESGNAAFDDSPHNETARILRLLADAIESGKEGDFLLSDINGNRVGRAFFEVWQD